MPIRTSTFKPPWWLRNPHLQTIWGPLMRHQDLPALQPERLELPDGDFTDIVWGEGASVEAPIVLLLHGLGGSIDSHYIHGILTALRNRGWRPLFIHFRGCSGELNRKPGSYHFGFTDDLNYIAEIVRQRFPAAPLCAIGYSLGGNVLLKWAAAQKECLLTAVVAVCVPFRPAAMVAKLNRGLSRYYQSRFVRELRAFYLRKHKVMTLHLDEKSVQSIETLREWDEKVTAPMWGFENADDYYQRSSSLNELHQLTTPTLIIHAADDPFMTESCLPEDGQLSPNITVEISQGGGHVGFINGQWPWQPRYWLEERIPEFLAKELANR